MSQSLSDEEMVTAGTVGLRRQVYALTHSLKPTDGAESNDDPRSFDHHILSALAEFYVARELNLFWDPNVGLTIRGDVGRCIEVRSRRFDGTGRDLVVKPKDAEAFPRLPYVLVHCRIPRFRMVGWAYADEAEALGGTWKPERGLWFIPFGNLHSMDKVPMIIAAS